MYQPLTNLTKAVAVALDIAGRPDTDDAYALNSVRKAYSLLNGATFQDLVAQHETAPRSTDFGIDWSEAYMLESSKTEALTRELGALRAQLLELNQRTPSPAAQPWGEPASHSAPDRERSARTERTRAVIVAALRGADSNVHDLSQSTKIHLRTVQRRIRELIADGLVEQLGDGISPLYRLAGQDR